MKQHIIKLAGYLCPNHKGPFQHMYGVVVDKKAKKFFCSYCQKHILCKKEYRIYSSQ